jgi:hypothetical protein
MEVVMKILSILLAVAAAAVVAAASAAGSAAGAGIGPDRCVFADLPGPEICEFSVTVHNEYPAGTRCAFDVTVHYVMNEKIFFFEDPDRAVAHIDSEGTATGNGNTLRRVGRFTETASPPFVLTDHGLIGRYSFPHGGVVTVWAGYQQVSIDPPLPTIFHGNPFDAEDDAAFCAALA